MSQSPRFAFFDVDDTLIQIKSMFDFFEYWALTVLDKPILVNKFTDRFSSLRSDGASRETLNREYYRFFAGVSPAHLMEAGEAWANERLKDPDRFFIPSTTSELKRLHKQGIAPVFVSGSFQAVLRPIAQELGVVHILAAQLELDETGRCTGNLSGHQTIGSGKAAAIRDFLDSKNANAAKCQAFGDDVSDLPMLESVGTPVVVGSQTPLAFEASSRGWRVLEEQ